MAAESPQVQAALKYDAAFKNFPTKDLFRLFIDKTRQVEGENTFDVQEPGYKKAMLNALEDMSKTIGNPLNANEYKRIRTLCITGVKNLVSDRMGFCFGKYLLHIERVSEEAREEWFKERLIMLDDDDIPEDIAKEFLCMAHNDYPLDKKIPLSIQWNFAEELDKKNEQLVEATATKKINEFFTCYYSAMQKANAEDEKLAAIVSLCRRLSIGHFFVDANQRTIVFILLNKLLIENNLSPVILEDPYVFDGYHSRRELIQDVKKGMTNFLSYKALQKPNATPPITSPLPQATGSGWFKPEKEKTDAKTPETQKPKNQAFNHVSKSSRSS